MYGDLRACNFEVSVRAQKPGETLRGVNNNKGGGLGGKDGVQNAGAQNQHQHQHQGLSQFPGVAALFPLRPNTVRFELVLGSCNDTRSGGDKEKENNSKGNGRGGKNCQTPVLKREAFINVYAHMEDKTTQISGTTSTGEVAVNGVPTASATPTPSKTWKA